MNVRLCGIALFIAGSTVLQGCAGLRSSVIEEKDRPERTAEGVTYHLPMRYFLLQIDREGGATKSASFSTTAAMPDLSKTYILSYHRHLIGKTTTTIGVGPSGLLTNADTSTTDSAAELAKIVPKSYPKMAGLAIQNTLVPPPCASEGSLIFVFHEEVKGRLCDVEFSIERLPLAAGTPPKEFKDADKDVRSVTGVFYRQERPFLTTLKFPTKKGSIDASQILLAPNQSPVMLLPYARTVFAVNDGRITLVDGTPQQYVQSTDGEFVALLNIPSAILSGYFTAVGNVFSAFSARDEKEQQLAVQKYKLALLAYKLARCKEALEQKDTTAMETLQCSSLSAD